MSDYICPQCSRRHALHAWALAHSDEEIVHTCECGAKNTLLDSAVIESMPMGWERPHD